jgi:CheY-like chemotaxis protein
MVRLIDDLMDVSRISRGKLQLRTERTDLVSILKQTLETVQSHLDQAGHQLTVSLPETPVYMDADPVRLTQVFLNLLNNACKYTDKGGHIRLSAEQLDANVVVTVSDNGIGIPTDYLSSLFEIFSQGPSGSEQSQGGLGIGLSLVRALVEMHGGSIKVKSSGAGKGSEFIVRLPVHKQAPLSEPATTKPDDKFSSALRVLVADDNQDVTTSLDMLLQLSGHEVMTANDGLQAIEATETFRPDVVLLDLGMPGMDGHGACQNIRQQPWGKDIKIFALTGMGREDDQQKSKETGFTGHLVKPVDPDVLLSLLEDQEATVV